MAVVCVSAYIDAGLPVLGGCHIRCLDSQHHRVHQVLGGGDQGRSTIQLDATHTYKHIHVCMLGGQHSSTS